MTTSKINRFSCHIIVEDAPIMSIACNGLQCVQFTGIKLTNGRAKGIMTCIHTCRLPKVKKKCAR